MRQLKIVSCILLFCIICCGCEKQSKHMFITQYENSDGVTYVYDQNNMNYEKTTDNYHFIQNVPYVNSPAIKYIPIEAPYSLSENFIGNYTCTVNDAFAYVTHLRDIGYKVSDYECTPYLCTMSLNKDDTFYKIFIEQDVTRIYHWNSDNKALDPEDTKYESNT